MGFFQDLKQDLSESMNDLGAEDAMTELNFDSAEEQASEDLFGAAEDTNFEDLEAMLTKNVAAIDEELEKPDVLEESTLQADANAAMMDTINDVAEIDIDDENVSIELEEEPIEIVEPEENDQELEEESIEIAESEESDQELEEELILNVEEQSTEKAADASAMSVDNFELTATSTDTAIITSQMSIVGDVTSSGNMDLIGTVTGNIEILGKLKVTGSITGNSKAAEIYADSAQINGEIRSDGSVKIGQSSVVIGNIFAASAVIAGAVKGDIDVQGPVILDTSAIVMGNIKSKSVQINNGAVIEGMCSQCYADVSPTAFFEDVKKSRKIE